MNPDLTGRHALVCGGSEGIGRAAAQALAERGADVTVLARRAERLAAVAEALPRPSQAQRHGFVVADAADAAGLAAVVSGLCAQRPVFLEADR